MSETYKFTINYLPNIEATVALTVSKRKGKKKSQRIVTKRETMRGSMHISSNTGDKGEQDVLVPCVSSILTIPRRGIKSCTIPIFPGSVCVSRLCLWKQTTGPPTSRIYETAKACMHAYTCSKFVPFEAFMEKWYEEWSNYATYCRTHTLFCRPHARAPEKLFHRRRGNCFDYERRTSRLLSLSLSLSLCFFFPIQRQRKNHRVAGY